MRGEAGDGGGLGAHDGEARNGVLGRASRFEEVAGFHRGRARDEGARVCLEINVVSAGKDQEATSNSGATGAERLATAASDSLVPSGNRCSSTASLIRSTIASSSGAAASAVATRRIRSRGVNIAFPVA
jgi:hypothetical protein